MNQDQNPNVVTSPELAIALNTFSQAFSGQIAISTSNFGMADAFLSISLGQYGRVIAREGGTIALAVYQQQPGRWIFPHGCDQTWEDGDRIPVGLKVSKVGENGIRAGFEYSLNDQGEFEEAGEAKIPNPYITRTGT